MLASITAAQPTLHAISGILWAMLQILIKGHHRARPEHWQRLLMLGCEFGVFSAAVALIAAALGAAQWLPESQLNASVPPLVWAISLIGLTVTAAALLIKLGADQKLAKRYFIASIAAIIFAWIASLWWWTGYASTDPSANFHYTWSAWLFVIIACGLLYVPLALVWSNRRSALRETVKWALLLFLLGELIRIPDMVSAGAYTYIFAPLRFVFQFLGTAILIHWLIEDFALQLQKFLNSLDTLEDRIFDRTHELQQAMENLEQANEALVDLSTIDPLTELKNRRYFDEALIAEWNRGLRDKMPLSVLIVDADHFKNLNDTHGHPFGDVCLKAIADVLANTSNRPADVVARYGGEEFVMLLPNTTSEGSLFLAENAREGISFMELVAPGGEDIRLTVSVGVVTAIPHKGMSPTDMVELADKALYQAKESGRNQVAAVVPRHS